MFRFCTTRWVEDKTVAERGLEVWKLLTVIKYWESLCKSKRPENTSYEIVTKHYKDPLIPAKLQFFEFVLSIFQPYLVIFQTNSPMTELGLNSQSNSNAQSNSPMIPFMFSGLEKIFNQLLRLVFRKGAIDQTLAI